MQGVLEPALLVVSSCKVLCSDCMPPKPDVLSGSSGDHCNVYPELKGQLTASGARVGVSPSSLVPVVESTMEAPHGVAVGVKKGEDTWVVAAKVHDMMYYAIFDGHGGKFGGAANCLLLFACVERGQCPITRVLFHHGTRA